MAVGKWKFLIFVALTVILIVIVFATGYTNIPATVNVATSSDYIKVYLYHSQYDCYLSGWIGRRYIPHSQYIVVRVFKNPLSTINFSNAPPGGKVGYKLLIANVANVTVFNVIWSSTLAQVTAKIVDEFPPIYKAFFWKEDGVFRYYVVYKDIAASWNTTLEPDDAILGLYQLRIAWDAPTQAYSWTLSITPAQ